jgi:hypothetical protein
MRLLLPPGSRAAITMLFLAIAGGAQAKTLPPCPPRPPQLFIAPMGEPFRATGDGPQPMAAWFAQVDRDGDGRITPAEFTADAERFFARLDTDHDGELIPSEVTAYESNIAPEIRLYAARGTAQMRAPSRKERKAAGVYGAPLGAGRWSFLNVPQPVASADADFNRGVTLAEFRAAATARFAQLDPTGRGFLDRAALPKTPAEAALAASLAGCDATRPVQSPPGASR